MKRPHKLAVLTILICMLPILSGCAALANNYKEIEQLLVIRTLGLDRWGEGVRLSLASSAEKSGGVRRLRAQGDSISAALEQAYNYSYEEELFCYHVDHILIGQEAAADGIGNFLRYISRSPIMRIDVPLFVVRGGTAEDAVMEVGEGGEGITEVMSSVHERLQRRGDSKVFSSADVMQALARYGSALVCAIDCGASSQQGGGGGGSSNDGAASGTESSGGSGKTAAAAGYAVIRDGILCGFIEPDAAVAVGLLINEPGVCDIQVHDQYGQLVVLQLEDGGSTLTPVWAAPGELAELRLHIDVRASVLELRGSNGVNSAEYNDQLTTLLERQIMELAGSVLASSQAMNADFLGLAGRVEQASPEYFSKIDGEFNQLLPTLPLSVSVSGQLSHTNDLKEEQRP